MNSVRYEEALKKKRIIKEKIEGTQLTYIV